MLPVDLTTTTAFPEEWRVYLTWGLADIISTGQPQAIVDRCAVKSEFYRMKLEDWDVEDTQTRFTPDQQMFQSGGSFR